MQYVLGNMLNGGGGLNPDGLSLDLQFAADKTLTARKGPTPVFTRASTATFVGSNGLIQTAATNIPRFDHDPVTLASRGLLIEEGRTNLLQHSSNFKNTTSSSYWQNMTATTVTVDQTTSPDGGVNADLLTTSATAFDCFTRRSGVYAEASTQYTYSIFVKRGPSNYRYVGFYVGAGTGGTAQFPYFDFDNPTIVQLPTITYGTINSTRVDPYPNGWYRISITFTTGATTPSTFAGVFISSSTGAAQSTNPAGNDCYIWGIQSELGSFPTSYIPTTTGTLARSADVCSITGGNFNNFYNQSEGTVVAVASEFRRGTAYVSIVRFAISSDASGNRFQIGTNGNKTGDSSPIEFIGIKAGVIQYQSFATSPTPESRAALAYKTDDIRGALNGTLSAADSPPSEILAGANSMSIGTLGIHIASIRYYRKRLPNAKLQALTV
jgi:hypothetical protein